MHLARHYMVITSCRGKICRRIWSNVRSRVHDSRKTRVVLDDSSGDSRKLKLIRMRVPGASHLNRVRKLPESDISYITTIYRLLQRGR